MSTSNSLISISAGNVLKCRNTVDATDSNSGSLITTGGAGIQKSLFVDGVTHLTNTTQSTSKTTGGIIISGGMGVSRNITIGSNIILDTGNTLYGLIPLWGTLKYTTDPQSATLNLNGNFLSATFVTNADRYVSGSFDMPRDWLPGSSLIVDLHWYTTTTQAAQNVQWQLIYTICVPGTAFSTTGTTLSTVTQTGVTTLVPYETNLGVIDMTGITDRNTVIMVRINRLGASDTYNASAYVNAIGCYYRLESLGTSTV